MKALVVAIGNELVNAKTQDYNAYWITKRLTSLGVTVMRIVFIPDDIDEILDVMDWGYRRKADLIVLVGGLGPTPGDLTLEAVSKFTNRELKVNEKALSFVKKRYQELYSLGFVDSPEINEFRLKMAKIPAGSTIIYNDVGVAPGVLLKHEGSYILALPGVPSEMMYVLEKTIPLLPLEGKKRIFVREERIVFGDESILAKIFEEIMAKFPKLRIKSYPEGFGKEIHMRIILEYNGDDEREAETVFQKAMEMLQESIKNL